MTDNVDDRGIKCVYTLTHLRDPRDYVLQIGHKSTLVEGAESDEWMMRGKAKLIIDTIIVNSVLACEDELNRSITNLTTTITLVFRDGAGGINVDLEVKTTARAGLPHNNFHEVYFNKLVACIKERAREYVLKATEDGQPDNQSTQPVKH